jgi:hypothetical protein
MPHLTPHVRGSHDAFLRCGTQPSRISSSGRSARCAPLRRDRCRSRLWLLLSSLSAGHCHPLTAASDFERRRFARRARRPTAHPVPRTAREVDRAMADHPGWRRVGKTLDRDLSMRDFDEALRLVERVAQMAVDNLRRPGTRISEFNGVPLNRQPAPWRADRGRAAPGGQDQRGDRRARGVRQLGAMAAAGALDFAGSWIAALIRTRAG